MRGIAVRIRENLKKKEVLIHLLHRIPRMCTQVAGNVENVEAL